jgi:hypothetical protein
MPVKQIGPIRYANHDALVRELLEEWNNPNASRAEPIILEESAPGARIAHVYVIWSKWEQMDRVERSEIIMEAAQRRLGPQDLANISIAMGLSAQEAQRLGLKY